MACVSELLSRASQRIDRSDALLVLTQLLNVRKETLIAHPERDCAKDIEETFFNSVNAIEGGYPATYILGHQEFWGRDFRVTPAVLIPRPDTETLIDCALTLAQTQPPKSILDLGTGSGAIAITLSLELPNAKVSAVDISNEALNIARDNAKKLNAPVDFLQGSWFEPCQDSTFDMIVSNPPYIHPEDAHLKNLTFEPQNALTDGIDGLSCLKTIIAQAQQHLNNHGVLILEHGYDQAQAVQALLLSAGFSSFKTLKDLGGNDRITYALKESNIL